MKNTNKLHLIIQTNSPGELSSWVSPIVAQFKETAPEIFITLCLVPCQYASGNEFNSAKKNLQINEVYKPYETVKICFNLKKINLKSNVGIILCLGGDPFYTKLLKHRTKFKAFIYTEHNKIPGNFFEHVFF